MYAGASVGQVIERAKVVKIHHAAPPPRPEDPESELQARFKRATGIDCSRRARIELEKLMRDHGFTAMDLKIAWNAGALQFPHQATQLKVVTGLWEAVWGWFMLALFAFYGFDVARRLLHLGALYNLGVETSLYALGLLVGFSAAIGMVMKHHILPRRIALRVLKIQKCTSFNGGL